MGAIAIIVGVPGVGKTSVVDNAVKRLRNENIDVEVVNYGTIMLEEALSRNLVSNRDEIRKLNVSQQTELQKLAAIKINEISNEHDILLLDTHLFIRTPRGRWPGLNQNNLKYLTNVRQIILVEASPEEIFNRRAKDISRIRSDYGDPGEISEDQLYNRYLASALSIYLNCPVYIVKNPEGMVDKAGEELYNILIKIVGEK